MNELNRIIKPKGYLFARVLKIEDNHGYGKEVKLHFMIMVLMTKDILVRMI